MKLDEIIYRTKYRLESYRLKNWKKPNYFKMYKATYHKSKKYASKESLYMTEVVSYGAGIGHQLANWIAGYWYARFFGVKYAYSPFTSSAVPFRPNKWDHILGFGEKEISAEQLLKSGYKKVLLPYFDEKDEKRVKEIQRIVDSYAGEKIVFFLEANQFYFNQYGVMDDLAHKFFSASARKEDRLIYDSQYYNVAIHIRRQVIIDSKVIEEDEATKSKRWTGNEYYEQILKDLVNLNIGKPIRIHIFSTGKPEEFESFKQYGDVRICSDLDEYASFVHLVYADMLVTSKSSFSYKPALMSKGIKICPDGFWHGYPDREDWFIIGTDGKLTEQQIARLGIVIEAKKEKRK